MTHLTRALRTRRLVAATAAVLALGVTASAVATAADSPTGYDGSGLPGLTGSLLPGALPALPLLGGASPTPVPAGTVTWPSGVHSGFTAVENDLFARWRGRPLQAVTLFQGSGSASEMADVGFMASQYRGRAERIVLSSALWPQGSGGTLAKASSGAYDEIFRNLARNLVANGMPATTIRLGWEFNGDFQPWKVLNELDAAHFANAWRRVVTAMRSVSGGAFTFDWAPVALNNLYNPERAFPVDLNPAAPEISYVDFIGMSVYNYTPNALSTPPAERFRQLKTWKYGLDWQVALAGRRGKPVSYPEWGAINRPLNPELSSGDDDFFIAAMFQHFAAVTPAYESYFDIDAPDLTFYGINTGSQMNPRSAAMYRTLWGRR